MKKNLPIQVVLLFLLGTLSHTLISLPPKLSNFGVSCYFNAIIQSLNATKPLINNLSQLEYDPKKSPADAFPQRFKSLLEAIQHNEFEKITAALHAFYLASVDKIIELQPAIKKTNDLKKDVAAVIQQEDASEFLTLLIDELKKDELSAKTINDIFFFQEVTHINELGENPTFRENKEQPNNQLSLPVFEEIEIEGEEPKISKSTSVKESLDIYFAQGEVLIKKEVFEYDEIQETYVSVDKYIPSTKQGFLDQLSEILIITLKRFYYAEGSNQKFQSSIEIPLELDLEKYCTRNIVNPNYELYATVNHRGDRANSGHYVAYVKENRNWYSCDDSRITPVKFDNVKNEIYKDGYILFYQKKSEIQEETLEESEEIGGHLKKEMKEAVKKELERIEKSRQALKEKIKAIEQQKEEEHEEESLELARQLEAEELETERQRLQKKQKEEQINLEKALEIALEEQEFPERKSFEEARQQEIKQKKEREEAATLELIRKLQEEDIAEQKAEQQRREQEAKKSEEEALRLAIEQQESYQSEVQRKQEIEQRKREELKRKEQEIRRKEQEERVQTEVRLEKERKQKAELTRLEKQRIEAERKALGKKYEQDLINALIKVNDALQQMLDILKK